jgi:hypothetical protein
MKNLVFVFVLSFPMTTIAGERLTSDELKALYTDKTIVGVHFKRGPGKSYYAPDGTIRSKRDNGSERMGKWWIDEAAAQRCVRWSDENKDLCHYTERNGDGTHTLIHSKDGKRLVEIKEALPGNQL